MRISRTHISRTCLVAALCLGLPLSAQAHRSWLLPSATVLSGDEVWVTVDAAVSNDLFYFEHFPLRIANIGTPPEALGARGGRPGTLMISAPDGTKVEPQNGSIGRYRSTFDVPLKQKGTYKLAVVNDGVFASFKEGGKVRRWRGDADAFRERGAAECRRPARIVHADPHGDVRDRREADHGNSEDSPVRDWNSPRSRIRTI